MSKKKKKNKGQVWWLVINAGGTGSVEPRLIGGNMVLADFENEQDAREHAIWADKEWPDLAPHRAILVTEVKET